MDVLCPGPSIEEARPSVMDGERIAVTSAIWLNTIDFTVWAMLDRADWFWHERIEPQKRLVPWPRGKSRPLLWVPECQRRQRLDWRGKKVESLGWDHLCHVCGLEYDERIPTEARLVASLPWKSEVGWWCQRTVLYAIANAIIVFEPEEVHVWGCDMAGQFHHPRLDFPWDRDDDEWRKFAPDHWDRQREQFEKVVLECGEHGVEVIRHGGVKA